MVKKIFGCENDYSSCSLWSAGNWPFQVYSLNL